jgi:hypothetical protein
MKTKKSLEERGLNLDKIKFILAWFEKYKIREIYVDPKYNC